MTGKRDGRWRLRILLWDFYPHYVPVPTEEVSEP